MITLPPAEYLAGIEPFSFLTKTELEELVNEMDVVLYKAGKVIFKRGKKIKNLYFVREGKVGLFSDDKLVEIVSSGELMGFSSLKDEKVDFEAKALEETICFEFKAEKIREVMGRNEDFKNFVNSIVSKRFSEIVRITRKELDLFTQPISRFLKREPVKCSLQTTLREVIGLMRRERVGSVAVVNENYSPVGIVTYADVIKALDSGMDFSTTVDEFMSSPVYAVDSEASVFDAYMKFALHSVRYLGVVENGRLVGVISLKDITSLLEPKLALVKYTKRIVKATDLEEIHSVIDEIDKSFKTFVYSRFSYMALGHIFSTVLDNLTAKIAEIVHGNSVTIAQCGEIGRREVDYPLRMNLVILSLPEKIDGCADPFCGIGLCSRAVVLDASKVTEELKKMSPEELLWLVDSRYNYGSGGVYVEFRNALSQLLTKEIVRGEIHKLCKEEVTEGNVDVLVESVARALSVFTGDLVSRPTFERLQMLSSFLDENILKDVMEAYIAVKQIKLDQKVTGGRDRLGDYIIKKSLGTVEEFFEYVGDSIL